MNNLQLLQSNLSHLNVQIRGIRNSNISALNTKIESGKLRKEKNVVLNKIQKMKFDNCLEIEFPSHKRENNLESEQHLYEHRKHFNKKNLQALQLLLEGKHLQVLQAANDYGIHSLPRRIADINEALLNHNIKISAPFINGTRIKKYFLLPDEIARIKTIYKL